MAELFEKVDQEVFCSKKTEEIHTTYSVSLLKSQRASLLSELEKIDTLLGEAKKLNMEVA